MSVDKYFTDFTLNKIERYRRGKKLVIWGDIPYSHEIGKALEEEHNIKTEFYVDSDKDKVFRLGGGTHSVTDLKSMCDKYFVYIPIRFYQDILDKLTEYGYKDEDYYYPASEPEAIYEDNRGNKILGYKPDNLHIKFQGYSSLVELGKNCELSGNIRICESNVHIKIGNNCSIPNFCVQMLNDSELIIGDNCSIAHSLDINTNPFTTISIGKNFIMRDKGSIWAAGSHAHIEIGDNCRMVGDFCVQMLNDSELIIGDNCTFGRSLDINTHPFTTISIGKDCMISLYVQIRSNDGHTIMDVKTGKNINSTEEISRKRKVVIGNHVWVGYRSIILYNTEIGDGSIIGAGSLVKEKIPNNCIAAGVPAKLIRRDVAWSREENGVGVDVENCICPKEYINMTFTDDE